MITINPSDNSIRMSKTLQNQIEAVDSALTMIERICLDDDATCKAASMARKELHKAFKEVKGPDSGKETASETTKAA